MTQDQSRIRIQDLKGRPPKETDKILLFGSPVKYLEMFRSFFKSLRPHLIFLDLSKHYDTTKTISRKENGNEIKEKSADYFQRNSRTHLCEISNEFWGETEDLLEKCKSILDSKGFFAVKVNGTVKFHLKSRLDAVFGHNKFVNEIIIDSPFKIWYVPNSAVFDRTNYILLYASNSSPLINPVLNEKQAGGYWHSFVSKGQGSPKKFIFGQEEVVLAPPPGTHWKLKQETILEQCLKGNIRLNTKGNPEYWVPPKKGQIIDTNWLDIKSFEWVNGQDLVNSSDLYKRLLSSYMNEGDFFLDISAELGDSLIVAETLKMKWGGIEGNKQLFDPLVRNLAINNVSFSPFECISLFKSSNSFNASYPYNNDINTTKNLNSKSCWSLQLIEKYNTPKAISNKENQVEWTNMLILGDSVNVLPFLNPKLQKQLKVIYIDPPFFTGTNENIVIPIGSSEENDLDTTENNIYQIEDLAYKNVLDASNPIRFFKVWLKKRILLMKPLLRDDGFIFVRFDYHFGHYAKIVLDEVFGRQNFINEFLVRRMKKNLSLKQAYSQTHLIVHSDSIFLYQSSEKAKINSSIIKKRKRKGQDFAEREFSGDNLWLDIAGYEKLKKTLYPTENSEALLSRIIQISSDKGDVIADFFCGSGTTAAVAEKLGRKWIGVDISHYSIHEIRKRILRMPNSTPFDIYNISSSQIPEIYSTADRTSNKGESTVPVAKIDAKVKGNNLEISIIGFLPSKPLDVHRKHDFIEYIDFWAIDWNYQNDCFQAMWYSFREMKGKKILKNIQASATYEYSDPGKYHVVATFFDVFGNDTKQSISINIH